MNDELRALNEAFKYNNNKEIMNILHDIKYRCYNQGFDNGYTACKNDVERKHNIQFGDE